MCKGISTGPDAVASFRPQDALARAVADANLTKPTLLLFRRTLAVSCRIMSNAAGRSTTPKDLGALHLD